LSTYAFGVNLVPAGEPLPRLRDRAHDSALVTDETQHANRDGPYAPSAGERDRAHTGERKPDTVPVHFAAGASSARLHGTVATGWYDAYTFAAARGQRVVVSDVSGAPVTLTLSGPGGEHPTTVRPGAAIALPSDGTFRLTVDGSDERATAYALTLAIK
jgi:hypothetical protein